MEFSTEPVEANSLPEYFMNSFKNQEGDETVHFVRRSELAVTDPNYEPARFARHRVPGAVSDNPLD